MALAVVDQNAKTAVLSTTLVILPDVADVMSVHL